MLSWQGTAPRLALAKPREHGAPSSPPALPRAAAKARRGACPPLLSRQGAVALLCCWCLLALAFTQLPRRLHLPAPAPLRQALRSPPSPWLPPAILPLAAAPAALVRYHLDLALLLPPTATAPSCPEAHARYAAMAAAVRAAPLQAAAAPQALPPGVRLAVSAALPPSAPPDAALVRAPGMTAATAAAFCAAPSAYPPDFQYLLRPSTCSDGLGEGRAFAPPWHNPPSDAARIFAAHCAHVESYIGDNYEGPVHRIIAGSVLSLQGNASFTLADASLRDHRPASLVPLGGSPAGSSLGALLPAAAPRVERHALLATPGPLRCGWCPGHFVLEALPILLLMDSLLPPAVPLLWPGGALPEAVALALRQQGTALRRPLYLEPRQPTLHQVDTLLYFQSGAQGGVPTSWLAQRFANTLLRGMVGGPGSSSSSSSSSGGAGAPLHALVALREGAPTRQLVNAAEVLAALQRALPRGAVVEAFTPGAPGSSFLQDGARFARACLVVGVHGANLGGALFMQPGCALLELAPLDAFSDYSGLGRNLGLQYFVSLGAGAHAARGFVADLEDLQRVLGMLVLPPAQ